MLNKKIGCILLGLFGIVELNAIDPDTQGFFQHFGLAGLNRALEKFKGTYQPIEDLQVYQKYFSAKYMYDTTSKGDLRAPNIYKDRTKSSLVLKDGYAYQLKFETEGQDPKVTLEALYMKQGINEGELKAIVDQIVKLVYGYFYEKSALAGYGRSGKYDLLASMIAKILNEVFYAYTKANNIKNFAEFFNNEKIRTDFISPMVDELRENYSKKLTLGKDANITAQFGDNITKKISSMSISGYTETYVEDGSAKVGALFDNDPRNLAQAWLLQRQYQKTYRLLDDLRNYEYSALASTGSLYSKPSLVIQGTETDVKYAYELSYQDTETKLVNFVLGSGFDLLALNKMALNIAKSAHGNLQSYLARSSRAAVSDNNALNNFVIDFVTSILLQAKIQGLADFVKEVLPIIDVESDANIASIIADITRDIYQELSKSQAGIDSNINPVTQLMRLEYNRKVKEHNDKQKTTSATTSSSARLLRVGTDDFDKARSQDTILIKDAQKLLKVVRDKESDMDNLLQETEKAKILVEEALKLGETQRKTKLADLRTAIETMVDLLSKIDIPDLKNKLLLANTKATDALANIKYKDNKTAANEIKASTDEQAEGAAKLNLRSKVDLVSTFKQKSRDLISLNSQITSIDEPTWFQKAVRLFSRWTPEDRVNAAVMAAAKKFEVNPSDLGAGVGLSAVAVAGTGGAAVPTGSAGEAAATSVPPPLPGPVTPPRPITGLPPSVDARDSMKRLAESEAGSDEDGELAAGQRSPARGRRSVTVTPATGESDGGGSVD